MQDHGSRDAPDDVPSGLEFEGAGTDVSPGAASHWAGALVPVILRSPRARGVQALDVPFFRVGAFDPYQGHR